MNPLLRHVYGSYGCMSPWPSVMPWPHACLCSDASHTTGKWLPLYVCHLQDIRDILDLLGHIMDPWIQCLHLRSWDDVSEYSSYWVASIPYYARTRRSLATIGSLPTHTATALGLTCILRDTVHTAGHDHDHHHLDSSGMG